MGKWKEVKLGDGKVTELIMGQSPPSSTYNTEKKGLPFFQGKKEFGELYPSVEKWCSEPNKFAESGDVLLSVRAPVGPTNLAFEKCCIGRGLASIRPNLEFIVTKFILYYFQNFEIEISSKGQGSTFQAISGKELRNLKIPLPPLAEQQRIVSKLDNLFADINEAIGLLEENIVHTQALMGSVLDEIYSNGDTMLKDTCNVGPKKSEIKNLADDLEVSFLPMKDLNEHDINFIPNEVKKIGEVYKGYTYFAEGDVLLAKVTPCFENGKAGLAKDLINGIGFGSSEYHILRPKENTLPEWIYFAVLTEQFRVTGKENMTGAGGLKRIPRAFLEEWKIPVPDLATQRKQIQRIVQIQEDTKKLEFSIQKKLNHLKSLKSSLLDQAFKGEL